MTISPQSQHHHYITISPLSQYHHKITTTNHHTHNITTITTSPLSQHHHYHNITTMTISPLSQYHHYHNITTLTISPQSQHHHYHNNTITTSPLSQQHYHNITTIATKITTINHHTHNITTITTSPQSQHHHYHNITTITISPQSQHHHYHKNTIPIWKPRTKASFSHLPLSDFEESLARKLRFHILHFHFFRQVSHESFVFTSSTLTFSGKSRTKASFSHLPLSLFQASLARKLRFHIFHFQASLARKLRFHIFSFVLHFHFFRQVWHESFVFTSSDFTFQGKSRTKCSRFLTPLRVVLLCFATQSLQIAL